jgi:SAM-dependent methyltransferase
MNLEPGTWNPDLDFFRQQRDILCCPRCGGALDVAGEQRFECVRCRHVYPMQDGIPSLFAANEWDHSKGDVTDAIKAFYEANPFPDYDEVDTTGSLLDKARRGVFTRLLDDQIPYGARILECGCGTGQLSNVLSIANNRTAIGTDLCVNSLKMATAFKQRNALERAHFLQMNLFRPAFKPATFDLVIANGVLHHTSDPLLGFRSIGPLVRPGGHVLIGLYHRFGRLATDLRRRIFNATGSRLLFLDRRTVDPGISPRKRRAWFLDQYQNPHESKHTVGEVLGWLQAAGFEFVTAIPKTVPFTEFTGNESLFQPERVGSPLERCLVTLGMMVTGHREGGFFIVIARRR